MCCGALSCMHSLKCFLQAHHQYPLHKKETHALLPARFPCAGEAVHRAAAVTEKKDPERYVKEAMAKGDIPKPADLPAPWGPKPYVAGPQDGFIPKYPEGFRWAEGGPRLGWQCCARGLRESHSRSPSSAWDAGTVGGAAWLSAPSPRRQLAQKGAVAQRVTHCKAVDVSLCPFALVTCSPLVDINA